MLRGILTLSGIMCLSDYGFGKRSAKTTPLNWAEGVPIGLSSAIYHADTVALLTRMMKERGIAVVTDVLAAR